MRVAAGAKNVAIEGEAALRERILGRGLRRQRIDEGEEFGRRSRADAAPEPRQRLLRPHRIILAQHGQVEQPFARIVDQVEGDAPFRQQPAERCAPLHVDRDGEGGKILGPFRPARRVGGQRGEMRIRIEAGHRLGARGLDEDAADAPARGVRERGQRPRPAPGGEQVGDERGEEDRLPGARKACDREPDALAADQGARGILGRVEEAADERERVHPACVQDMRWISSIL